MHGTSKFVFVGARWEQQWLLGGSLLGTWEENSSLLCARRDLSRFCGSPVPLPPVPLRGGLVVSGAQRVFLGQVVQELLCSLVIMDCQQPKEGSSAQHRHCKER